MSSGWTIRSQTGSRRICSSESPTKARNCGLQYSTPPSGVVVQTSCGDDSASARYCSSAVMRRGVQARVVDRDGGLRRNGHEHPLVSLGEHARLRVAEEQSAVHFAGARDHRHREVAAHRQVALGHAVVRRVLAVARVLRDVVRAHDALPRERRGEHVRVAGHREARELLPRHARERVEHVAAALGLRDVVEERAELRAAQGGRLVGQAAEHRVEVEVLRRGRCRSGRASR